jgi:hypothetical protein
VQHQLVLQFRGDARDRFDQVPDAVKRLAATLDDTSRLDGDDIGTHGANLFIFTDNPQKVLADASDIFPGVQSSKGFSAAYRQVSSERFQVIWPLDSPTAFSLRPAIAA